MASGEQSAVEHSDAGKGPQDAEYPRPSRPIYQELLLAELVEVLRQRGEIDRDYRLLSFACIGLTVLALLLQPGSPVVEIAGATTTILGTFFGLRWQEQRRRLLYARRELAGLLEEPFVSATAQHRSEQVKSDGGYPAEVARIELAWASRYMRFNSVMANQRRSYSEPLLLIALNAAIAAACVWSSTL